MKQLATFLEENADRIADEVIAEWRVLGEREPWHRVPENLDQDHLPDMIRGLAQAALFTFFALEPRRTLAWSSVEHGQHRFQQGAAEEVLSREYELLRWALWRRFKEQASSERAAEAIIRIDSALTFAHGASLRGYHRAHIELSGEWPQAIEHYMNQWAFPA